MKPNILVLILALFAALVLMVSCATTSPPQVQAYQTIGEIDAQATSIIEGMDDAAIKQLIPTNDIPKASKAYDDLHQALIFASETAEQGTNSIAPPNLATNLFNLTMLVGSIMAQKH